MIIIVISSSSRSNSSSIINIFLFFRFFPLEVFRILFFHTNCLVKRTSASSYHTSVHKCSLLPLVELQLPFPITSLCGFL